MEAFQAIYGFYVVPAAVLFGVTIVIIRILKTPTLVPFEYASWLIPGITYWVLSEPLNLEQAFQGKSLANMAEPAFVAGISWVIFLLRLLLGAKVPRLTRPAAVWCAVACNLSAFLVLVFTPLLPE